MHRVRLKRHILPRLTLRMFTCWMSSQTVGLDVLSFSQDRGTELGVELTHQSKSYSTPSGVYLGGLFCHSVKFFVSLGVLAQW